MVDIRRSFIKIGTELAIDFANTVHASGDPAGTLHSWADLVDFLELRGAVGQDGGATLRTMGEQDARRSAMAFTEALRFREIARAVLAAMAAGRHLRAGWIAQVNQVLSWGGGTSRLVRQGTGWRFAFVPDRDEPLQALAPIARSLADLLTQGRGGEVRKCANPRCVLYFHDPSRTRRRRWCSMAVCGNRMKVAAHARRYGRRRRA